MNCWHFVNYKLLTRSDELNHFDATAFAFPERRHVVFVQGIVEGVVTAGVFPAVAFEALDCGTGHAVSAGAESLFGPG